MVQYKQIKRKILLSEDAQTVLGLLAGVRYSSHSLHQIWPTQSSKLLIISNAGQYIMATGIQHSTAEIIVLPVLLRESDPNRQVSDQSVCFERGLKCLTSHLDPYMLALPE